MVFRVHDHVQTIKHCSAFEACLILLHLSECLLSQPGALHATFIQWHCMSCVYHVITQGCWNFSANLTFNMGLL